MTLEVKLGRKTLQPHRLTGSIVWERAEKGGRAFGVTFDGLAADEQAALEAVVEEFHRLASQLS